MGFLSRLFGGRDADDAHDHDHDHPHDHGEDEHEHGGEPAETPDEPAEQ
jgi:hypothetical protein